MKWKKTGILLGIASLLALLCCCVEKSKTEEERKLDEMTGYGLGGYVGENLTNNIRNWQTIALQNNPNIVALIKEAGQNMAPLSAVQMATRPNQEYAIEAKGGNSGKALAFRQLKDRATYGDLDFKFTNDPTTIVDWTGAKELWVYFNASEYGTKEVPIGLSFEEYNLDKNGKLTSDRESWCLRNDSTAYIRADGSDEWQEVIISRTRVTVPAGFRGWIRVKLDTDHYTNYWSSNGCNQQIDLKDVHQFQLCVVGNQTAGGQTCYFDSFGIVGDVNGEALPVSSPDAAASDSFLMVWSMEGMLEESIQYTGSVMPWYGEFAGKLLTGMAYNYKLTQDPSLLEAGNALVAALKDAQGEDGYLGVFSGANRMGGHGANWDVWGHYHCITGLTKWHQIAGNEEAMQVAIKALDFVYNYFVGTDTSFHSAGEPDKNLAIGHAFALVYQETKDERYLNAAKKIVEEDMPLSGNWLNSLLEGKDYYQTSLPRWESLHVVSALGALYEITGEERYYKGLEAAWWSIAKTDRHNDGGFSTGEGAIGTPYQDTGIETCCTVAWMALSTEYLRISKNSYVADELELSFFNGMMGSLLADDKYVTYNTPMNGQRLPSQGILAFQMNGGSVDFNCCQANVARGLGEVSQWAVMHDETNLYLNYYGPAAIKTTTPAGSALGIVEDTVYPQNGAIKIQLLLEKDEAFRLQLRIPFWSANTTVKVNGRKVDNVVAGQYLTLERTWKNGDTIEISLDMSLHYWVGENEQHGRTSIYCGPILLALDPTYCQLESNVVLTPESLQNNLVVSSAAADGAWLYYTTKTADGQEIRLVDFSSAGQKDETIYYSWLNVNSTMEPLTFVKGEVVVWNNKP